MARKQWAQLTPKVQRRYLLHGIGPAEHAAGVSLKSARGHGQTPERPSRVTARNQDQFAEYSRRLIERVIRRKAKDFANRINFSSANHAVPMGASAFSATESERAVREVDITDPDIRRAMQEYLRGEIDIDALDWSNDETKRIYSFLFYHPSGS